jgi:DNA replication and repair protein RecF
LPYWQEHEARLLGLGLQIGFSRGWPAGQSLATTLLADEARDKERGITTHGAHRADLTLRMGRYAARDVLSRGQQKLAAVAMTLAQLQCLQATAQLRPTLLLDDPAAELDATHLGLFIERPGQGVSRGTRRAKNAIMSHLTQGGACLIKTSTIPVKSKS